MHPVGEELVWSQVEGWMPGLVRHSLLMELFHSQQINNFQRAIWELREACVCLREWDFMPLPPTIAFFVSIFVCPQHNFGMKVSIWIQGETISKATDSLQ